MSRNTSGGRAVVTIKCTPNGKQKNHILLYDIYDVIVIFIISINIVIVDKNLNDNISMLCNYVDTSLF